MLVFNSHVRGHGEIRIIHNKQGRNFNLHPKIQERGGLTCILGRLELSGVQVLIEHNSASNGGAVLAVSSGVVLDGKITLSGNSATDTGGGIYAYHSEIVMNGNILIANS